MQLTRRDFFFGSTALALSGCRIWREPPSPRAYSVAVFGDMHYDADPMEKFHSAFLSVWGKDKDETWRLGEFRRNGKMWSDLGRRILASAGACATPDTDFVLQLGDLVQGDCRDLGAHRRMLDEAAMALSDAFGGRLPVLSVCGNHDLRLGTSRDGNDQGAEPAYRAFAADWNARACARLGGEAPEGLTFALRHGPDLFVFIDFNHPSAARVKELLAENEDVRYTFIVTHGPLSPMDYTPRRWFLYGYEPDDPVRNEMRALFARRNAIVLAGHVHSLEHKEFVFPEGRISEMVMSTMVRSFDKPLSAVPQVATLDPARYGRIKALEDSWVPGLPELFAEWRPHLKSYFLSRATGHFRLRVSDEGVWVDYYGLDARTPTRTFELRRKTGL